MAEQDEEESKDQGGGGNGGALECRLIRALGFGDASQGNLVLSPLSVSFALSLLAPSARGETLRTMLGTLKQAHGKKSPEIGDDEEENVQLAAEHCKEAVLKVKDYNAEFETKRNCTLMVAGRAWVNAEFPLNEEYEAIVQDQAQPLDVSDAEEAKSALDSWCSERTDELVKDVGSEEDFADADAFRVLLTSVAYIKAAWKEPFDESETKELPFFTSPSREEELGNVPTMHALKHRLYSPDVKGHVVVRVDQAKSDSCMLLALPKSEDVGPLTCGDVTAAFDTLRGHKIDLFLPKFHVECSVDLKEALAACGLSALFEEPDLGGLLQDAPEEKPLLVNAVRHRCVVQVDEKGAEEVSQHLAVHADYEDEESPPPPEDEDAQPVVKFDHPFQFFIVDYVSDTILFAGFITAPTSENA